MEEEILRLVMQGRGRPLSVKEVGKSVDRRQYKDNPLWARDVLEKLVDRRLLSKDVSGYYFYEVPSKSESSGSAGSAG